MREQWREWKKMRAGGNSAKKRIGLMMGFHAAPMLDEENHTVMEQGKREQHKEPCRLS